MKKLIEVGDVVMVTRPRSISVYGGNEKEGWPLDVVVAFNRPDGAMVFAISADLAARVGEALLDTAKKVMAKNGGDDA